MKEIKLTRNQKCLVDDDLFDYLSKYKWHASGKIGKFYASSRIDGKIRTMHRLIMDAPDNLQVDHINGNRLDNRKVNLRLCSNSFNLGNRGANKNNTSGFKGVGASKHGRFVAKIQVNRKYIHLGYFDTPIEAAHAYNQGAEKYFGEFAKVNQI